MKIMKKLQIYGAILLIIAIFLSFVSCAKEDRFDYSELNLRLTSLMPSAQIDESALFFSDDTFYYYYSLVSEHDTLLSLRQDADGLLDRVSLTADEMVLNTAYDVFRTLSLALAEAFIPQADTDALREGVCFDDQEALRAKILCTYTQGFYKASLFYTPAAVCFMLRYE